MAVRARKTLAECGEEFGIMRERVRQIALQAADKLRTQADEPALSVLLAEEKSPTRP